MICLFKQANMSIFDSTTGVNLDQDCLSAVCVLLITVDYHLVHGII